MRRKPVTIDNELYEEVAQFCKEKGRNPLGFIDEAVSHYLKIVDVDEQTLPHIKEIEGFGCSSQD